MATQIVVPRMVHPSVVQAKLSQNQEELLAAERKQVSELFPDRIDSLTIASMTNSTDTMKSLSARRTNGSVHVLDALNIFFGG